MKQRWVARWVTSGGLEHEYRFISLSSRVIARLDLALKLLDRGYAVPNEMSLEEDRIQPGEFLWDAPTMRRKGSV